MGIGINRILQHHSWEYFIQAAKWLYGIHRVNLTGGEPTCHPNFNLYAPKFRELFNCKQLTMVTNGYRVSKYEDLIVKTFDYIDFTDYEDQRPALESISKRMQVTARHEGVNGELFIPRASTGNGRPCTRACWRSFGCAYADGKFWGCCITQSLSGAVPVEPAPDWSTRLLSSPLPCSTCFFSE